MCICGWFAGMSSQNYTHSMYLSTPVATTYVAQKLWQGKSLMMRSIPKVYKLIVGFIAET